MTKQITANPSAITRAVSVLKDGGLIIYPTETSYGLGADASNSAAIEKLLAYKGNRLNKAISVAVADQAMAARYIEFNPTVNTLFNTVLPGPVTVISTSKGLVAKKVESERRTLGIRYSSNAFVNQLVQAFGQPITATSANTSGTKQIYSFADWHKYVSVNRQQYIDLFIDAGPLPVRPPSTIVDTTLNQPEILRQGEIIFGAGAAHYDSHSPEDTMAFGKELLTKHFDLLTTKPIILALEGDLGAGKTHFAKGIAQALGITTTVTSPTYTIMREYPYTTEKINGILYHIDTWRLFDTETLDDLNIKTKLKPGTIVIIEWQQKANEWLQSLENVAIAYIKLNQVSETNRQLVVKWT